MNGIVFIWNMRQVWAIGTFIIAMLVQGVLMAGTPRDRPNFTIKKASGPVKLDAVLDEQSWKDAEVVSDLIQQFPYDTSRSRLRTEFRATYDDQFLYFSAVAYDNTKGGYVVSSLRRDFRGPGLDGVTVILDPFQDVTNGFFFGLSPAGVQREALISNGYLSETDIDLSWDNKWYSEVKVYDGYYVAEWAIPFTSIRFKAGSTRWNIKYYRQDSKENERACWPLTPRFFQPGNLNYTSEMVWDQPLKHPGTNVSIIPYMAGNISKDFLNNKPSTSKVTIGGDAKIAVTPSLNLDLTVNPDFSQVEVDRQVTNLDRFEIFYPERRQFFLENADLFSAYGHIFSRPFFSRRIGVVRDPNTGLNRENKIIFGARLSGNLNKYYRIGLLNMQTGEIPESGIPSYNYTVATGQRRLGTNSNIRAIFVNRQEFKTDSGDFKLSGYNYNRVAGLDYNYSFLNNRWTGNLFYHKLFTQDNPGSQYAQGYSLVYNTQRARFNLYEQIVGRNYDPAVGYVPRKGYKRISPSGGYLWYPKSARINSHGPTFDGVYIWDDKYGLSDREFTPGYSVYFQSQGTLNVMVRSTYTYLLFDFDPTNSPPSEPVVKLPAFSEYTYTNASVMFQSDPKKYFTYVLNGLYGQYFNGMRTNLQASLNYRWQPYGVFSLDMNFNRIALPQPYTSADIYLIGPRIDLTLTRSVFFTTLVQYNSQYQNMSINSRFQWRFKPVSDLFIVYTDNYFYSPDQPNENFTPKNRALVVKLTYWLNL